MGKCSLRTKSHTDRLIAGSSNWLTLVAHGSDYNKCLIHKVIDMTSCRKIRRFLSKYGGVILAIYATVLIIVVLSTVWHAEQGGFQIMYPELFYGTSIGALIAMCILTATMLQSRSDKNDIMRVLKKINKRIKTNQKKPVCKLSTSQKEPVGNQTTLYDTKTILLRIEYLLSPSKD